MQKVAQVFRALKHQGQGFVSCGYLRDTFTVFLKYKMAVIQGLQTLKSLFVCVCMSARICVCVCVFACIFVFAHVCVSQLSSHALLGY